MSEQLKPTLDYLSPSLHSSRRLRLLFTRRALLSILAVILILAIIGPFRYGYFSVCSVCGRVQGTSRRELPLICLAYWISHSEEDTLISKTVTSAGLVTAHQHDWVFGHGGGNGRFGSGPGISMRRAADSPDMVRLIQTIAQYEGKAAAQRLIHKLLDYRTTREVQEQIMFLDLPPQGLSTLRDYRQWRDRQAQEGNDLKGLLADDPAQGPSH
ncbi:MAG: hypothetical protein NTU53_15425 [Planctomycetota bacterium]|nr:hypothetical protein [Planctomycetota bacterium]